MKYSLILIIAIAISLSVSEEENGVFVLNKKNFDSFIKSNDLVVGRSKFFFQFIQLLTRKFDWYYDHKLCFMLRGAATAPA